MAGPADGRCGHLHVRARRHLQPALSHALYLIQGRGLTSAQAGLILTTQPLVMAIMAPFAGTFSDRIGAQIPTSLGMLVMAGGLFMLTRMTSDSPISYVVIASGVLALAPNVGMALGVGLTGAVFTTMLAKGQSGDPTTLVHAVNVGLWFATIMSLLAATIFFARGVDYPKST